MNRSAAARLGGIEILVVPLIVGLAMVDAAFLLPAVLIAALFWPLRRFAAGRWTVRTAVDPAVGVILAAAAVSAAVSVDRATTLPQILRLLAGIGLLYAIVNGIGDEVRLRAAGLALVGVGVALAGAAFVTVDWADNKLPFIPAEVYALFPTLSVDLIHPNVLGGILLLFAPLSAAVFLWGGGRAPWVRWAAFLAFVFMAAIMILSQSRSALLGLGLAVLLLVSLRWRWGWLVFVLAAAAAAWAVSLLGVHNFTDLLFGSRVFGGFQGRTEIWGRAIFMLQDFPFTGVGMGLFPQVAEKIYPFFTTSTTAVHAHNLFIQVGVDLGLPGLIAFLAIFLHVTWIGFRLHRAGSGRGVGRTTLRGVGGGILAVQFGLLVHGLFDAVVWGQIRGAPLLWAVWGFALAAWNLHQDEEPLPGPSRNNRRAGENEAAITGLTG